jgi:hypothetical protein
LRGRSAGAKIVAVHGKYIRAFNVVHGIIACCSILNALANRVMGGPGDRSAWAKRGA